MSEIIYVLTVLYFSYVIYVVLGDEIENCLKNSPLRYSPVFSKFTRLTKPDLPDLDNFINAFKAKLHAKTNHR